MKKQMIKDLRIGDEVETQALVIEANRTAFASPHRAGDYFLKLVFGDVSGRIKAVMWDPPEDSESIAPDDVVFLRGSVGDYHGPQIVVNNLRRLDPSKVNRAFFQPVSPRDLQAMRAELASLVNEEITEPPLRDLLRAFFNDEEFMERFARAPAARTIHHNYVGGLIEHTLEVAALCRNLAALYPGRIRLPLLLTGALLHDMGKIEEYRADSISFDFTDRGRLVGHISIGKEMLDQRISALPVFPDADRLELEHMILSHHGLREWGSPEVPKTINAFALYHADLVSARLNQFNLIIDKHPTQGGSWTDWDRFLERSIYLGTDEREE